MMNLLITGGAGFIGSNLIRQVIGQPEISKLVSLDCLTSATYLKPELEGHSRSLITFVSDRPGHDRRYAMDATKIGFELGWNPDHTLEKRLHDTVSWYLQHQGWVESITRD